MSRPRKNTVDYFPHDCTHGKTMFVLEKNFGNNGYALWFKLLELLGSTENHYLDLRESEDFEFFVAKIGVSVTETIEILDLLSRLKAIDPELWSIRVVWSDNFMENITDVYDKRTNKIPEKPSFRDGNSSSSDGNEVSDIENPQSKVEESKVEGGKEKIVLPPAELVFQILKIKNKSKLTSIEAAISNIKEPGEGERPIDPTLVASKVLTRYSNAPDDQKIITFCNWLATEFHQKISECELNKTEEADMKKKREAYLASIVPDNQKINE